MSQSCFLESRGKADPKLVRKARNCLIAKEIARIEGHFFS
jgi:hypothetical protein